VVAYWKRLPNTEAKAILYGLITRVNKKGGIMFLVLNDGTGSIQLIAKESDFSKDDWIRIETQKEGSRVQIDGLIGESKTKRLSVFLKEVPCELRELKDKGLSLAWPNIKVVSSQMLLSRIRKHCANYLELAGFLEIEPLYISLSWQDDGLHPLEVKYPGFGSPVFLVPSPSPQILKAIVTTGNPKIFSVSRCFSGEFRDTMDRTETVLICAKVYPASWNDLRSLAVDGIKALFSNLSMPLEHENALKADWLDQACKWPPTSGHLNKTNKVHIELFEEIQGENKLFGKGKVQIFRVNWPHQAGNVYICDGLIESYEDGFKVGTVNWHADRIVHILENTVNRQLLSLDYWTKPEAK
jgi:aspartyl/asparaginyl-tRNA synthetase